jgi:hypothetical protein
MSRHRTTLVPLAGVLAAAATLLAAACSAGGSGTGPFQRPVYQVDDHDNGKTRQVVVGWEVAVLLGGDGWTMDPVPASPVLRLDRAPRRVTMPSQDCGTSPPAAGQLCPGTYTTYVAVAPGTAVITSVRGCLSSG